MSDTNRLNRRSIDPLVIGTLVAGVLIILLLVLCNGGFPTDIKGLSLGPTQPNYKVHHEQRLLG